MGTPELLRPLWALFIFLAIFSPSAQVHKCSHSDAQTLSKMVGWVIHPWDPSILIGSQVLGGVLLVAMDANIPCVEIGSYLSQFSTNSVQINCVEIAFS